MSGEFASALAERVEAMRLRMNAEVMAYIHGVPVDPEYAAENERLHVALNGAQPAEWVEDRRVRLTPFEAQRGILPAPMTPLEWRRMNDASRAHGDAALHRSLQRALLGP